MSELGSMQRRNHGQQLPDRCGEVGAVEERAADVGGEDVGFGGEEFIGALSFDAREVELRQQRLPVRFRGGDLFLA